MHADKSDEANAREDGQTKIGKKGSGSRDPALLSWRDLKSALYNFTTLQLCTHDTSNRNLLEVNRSCTTKRIANLVLAWIHRKITNNVQK